jgi:two-component system phosphate regulon sensor histidine kinase PhoR
MKSGVSSAIISFTAIIILIGLVFVLLEKYAHSLLSVILLFALFFMLTFWAVRYIYQHFYRNTLLNIYNKIVQVRSLKSRDFRKLNSNDIETELSSVIDEWSEESKEEIDHMKQVEIYRKEFLSNVSHELKTPIFSVQGYIHTLIDGGIEDKDINMLYLQKAAKGIDRLINMVDDLESITRIESGELLVECRTFDIIELVRDVIESLEMQAKDKIIKLYIEENLKPVYVYADKDLIRQVLVNLLANSIKYGKKNGTTTVSFTVHPEKAEINIKDDGIGIEKYHLPRLFERFYRVDKSRSREEGGTGLGLAIVKHIMEAHQQSIHVESTHGQGTLFSFSLARSK